MIPPSNSSNISHPLQFQKGNSFVSKGSVTFSNCNTVSTEGGVRVECVERVVSVLRKNILYLRNTDLFIEDVVYVESSQ